MHPTCDHCHERHPAARPKMEVASWLMLALLPKCPFCIMAFTSTAMLCGEGVITTASRTHNSPLTIIITAILGITTLTAILLNRKGSRTFYAFGLAFVGFGMIMYSVIRNGGQPLYYTGILTLFLGVWMNGSLPWLWKSIRPRRTGLSAFLSSKFTNGSGSVSAETRRG